MDTDRTNLTIGLGAVLALAGSLLFSGCAAPEPYRWTDACGDLTGEALERFEAGMDLWRELGVEVERAADPADADVRVCLSDELVRPTVGRTTHPSDGVVRISLSRDYFTPQVAAHEMAHAMGLLDEEHHMPSGWRGLLSAHIQGATWSVDDLEHLKERGL